jgi:hypothetical protein
MNCCDGKCEQGRDCPVRQQRIKETNDAYINGKPDPDPYRETLGSFKELITVIVVATAVGLLAYVVWGKL